MHRATLFFVCVSFLSCAALADSNSSKSVDRDLHELHSRNARVQREAADRLVAAGPKVIPVLLPLICDKAQPDFDQVWPAAARALGALKAEAAAPCLVPMLMWNWSAGFGPVEMKPDSTLLDSDPAFAALVQIGEPAVPVIRRRLPFMLPDPAISALRVLRMIGTPSAKQAAEAYLKFLDDQTKLTKDVLSDFGKGQSQ